MYSKSVSDSDFFQDLYFKFFAYKSGLTSDSFYSLLNSSEPIHSNT